MLPNPSNLPEVYDRSATPTHANVDGLLFAAGRRSQSAELNDMQQYLQRRIDGLGSAIFSDGSVVEGAVPAMTSAIQGQTISIPAGKVFVKGKIYSLAAVGLNIPLNEQVAVGVRRHTSFVDYLDDPTLLSPAVRRRGYGEPGAYRAISTLTWGWKGSGGGNDGSTDPFFPIYSVDNGVVIVSTDSPTTNLIYQALAQYDNDANGSYVSAGLRVQFVAEANTTYSFQVDAGVAHLFGKRISRGSDTRLTYTKDPDQNTALNEFHIFTPDVNGKMNVIPFRPPVSAVTAVTGQKLHTNTVVRGQTVGGSDVINVDIDSIVSVQLVTQGGTTYGQGTDFVLVGDEISWIGGTQPATGSTYTVAFTYYDSLGVPESVTAEYIVLSGYVPGQAILITYTYKLPRVDLFALNADGTISRIEGTPALQNPGSPTAGPNQIALATVQYDWVHPPSISNVAIRAVIMSDLEDMRANIFDLFQLIAQQELKSNIAQTDTQTKLGVFVDAFKDDSQRDHGTAQTAAIVSGFLTLPLATVASFPDGAANLINQTLPFTPVVAIAQPMVTQCAIINAYVNLSPLDGTIKLNPFSDSWSVYVSQYTSQLTTLIVQSGLIAHLDPVDARSVRRRQQLAGATTAVEVVTPSQINQELTKTTTTGIACRQLPIAVSMAGFMPGEKIIEATFDGVSLASLINVTAGLGGAMTGSFTIPAGVPTGIKLVSVLGDLGTTASTTYSASFNVLPGLPPPPVPQYIDPLAQTFVPDEDMQVCAVDVKFCKKGPTLAPVLVQIRDVVNGYPGPTAFCSQSVPVSAMNVLDTITVAATLSSCGSINNIAPTTQIVPPAQGEVGFHQNGNLRHVWAKFNLPSDLAGSTVSSARLTMRLYHSTPVTTLGGNPRPFFVTASRLTESFDPASVSWNVRQNGQAWTTPGGTYNSEATDGNSLMPTPLTTPRPPFWQANDLNPDAYNIMVSWDVSNIVEEWAGGVVNNGILLRGAREQFRTTQTLAALAYFDFAGFSPTLEITYKPVSSGLLGEGWTRVAFDVPTFVKGGTQYALTLLTSDPGHSVSFARLGDMMEANNNNGTAGLVVQNPYGPGVLFDSPNNATWIARPKDDLTFRILRASYNPTTSAVNLGNVAATTATDFIVRALIGRFSGDTIINFNVTPPGGTATKVENGQTLPLTAQVSGNFAVQAEISGTEKLSPILYANTIGVVGTLSSPGTYASIRVSSAQTFTAHVILQAFLPSGSTVLVQVATATYAGGSRVVVDGVHQFTWAEMTLDTTTAADNGYVQQVWSLTGVKGVTLQNVSQVKVTLAGSPSARLLAKGLQFYTK